MIFDAQAIFGGFAVLDLLGQNGGIKTGTVFACVGAFALTRGILRYAEQSCNHFIAFKLLALIRDKVFRALRRLAPAKLEGRDKGDLISVITSDIELLEVFYAHTISPAAPARGRTKPISLAMTVNPFRFFILPPPSFRRNAPKPVGPPRAGHTAPVFQEAPHGCRIR